MSKKVVIVGGGIGGLSSAILLKKKGFEVTLLEKNDKVGGRARSFSYGDYKFDMGPSWYLMPEVFQKFFREIGEEPISIKRVNPSLKLIVSEKEKKREIEVNEKIDELSDYLRDTEFMYKIALEKFLNKEMKITDFLDSFVIRNFSKIPLITTLDSFNSRYFKDDFMRKLLGFSAVFLGGSPYKIPGIYAIVNYSIFGQGVFYPEGGFEGYVEKLYEIGKKEGVEFRTNFNVDKVKIENERVIYVSNDIEKVEGDIFLFNMDYHYADSLLPYEYRVGNWDKRKIAPSALLAYLGVDGEKLELPHHTIIINGDWKDHFNSIEKGKLPNPKNMSYYVSYRRATDDKLIANDIVILIPVAAGVKNDKRLVEFAIKDLKEKTGLNFNVKFMRIYGPEDFENDYNAFKGTAFGLSHTLDQTGPFRLPMKNKHIKNLYYVGQYTQPGIGVPMVTLSAMFVTKKILGEQGI